MAELELKSYAKINLLLNIVSKRQDGYHILETVMQNVDIYDEVKIKKTEREIKIHSDSVALPKDHRNIAYQAADKMIKRYGLKEGCYIDIKKNIPQGAGLAGGSSNGAAVLIGMNHLWQLGLNLNELRTLGQEIGADIPFCLTGGTCLAEGIGEIVTPVPPFEWRNLLIVQPELELSTKEMYSLITSEHMNRYPMQALLKSLNDKAYLRVIRQSENIFEKIACDRYPQISKLKQEMLESGAIKSLMTGSGSAVVGFYKNEQELQIAFDFFKRNYLKTYKTKTINRGVSYGEKARHH